MAERRMLAKSIVESDMFSDMPTDSQMLYIRLNMAADDDGFVDNPRTIMKAYGFSDDNMKLLVAKKFVLTFQKGDNFIYLIKHWRVNNYIRKDRYQESKYKQLLRDVYYDENGAYSLNSADNIPCLPDGNQAVDIRYTEYGATQDRLGKDRIGKSKDRIGEDNTNNNSVFIYGKDDSLLQQECTEAFEILKKAQQYLETFKDDFTSWDHINTEARWKYFRDILKRYGYELSFFIDEEAKPTAGVRRIVPKEDGS